VHLTSQQIDRAVGVLVGQAAGDALGVPYEFGTLTLTGEPQMLGGGLGGIAPGQWSDDTEMALCIAEVAATGADLRADDAQERIAQGFLRWYQDEPPDIGVQTRSVLGETLRLGGPAATTMRSVSEDLHRRTGVRPATAPSCAPVRWRSPTSVTSRRWSRPRGGPAP
jgi:ADP-ribosylglycohydrolase